MALPDVASYAAAAVAARVTGSCCYAEAGMTYCSGLQRRYSLDFPPEINSK